MVKHLSTMQETWVRSLGQEVPWRRKKGNPLQYSCLENPMDGGAWCPWGRKELDTTERLHFSFSFLYSPTLTFILTTGKTIALTRWTFVGKVMSLFFHMLSRLVIAFLPRSKRLLISWLQSPSAVILECKKLSQPLFPLFLHLFALN